MGPKLYLAPFSRYGATKLETTPPYFKPQINPCQFRHQTEYAELQIAEV